MRILNLEDSVSKHSEICAVLLSCGIKAEDIVWVTNLMDGIDKIKELIKTVIRYCHLRLIFNWIIS